MTAIDLPFFLILIGVGIGVGSFVVKFLGIFAGIVAGVLAVVGFVYLINIGCEAGHRRHCRKMAEKYTKIFRVRVLPADEKALLNPKIAKLKWAIMVGNQDRLKRTA
jgi:hypothetical protein